MQKPVKLDDRGLVGFMSDLEDLRWKYIGDYLVEFLVDFYYTKKINALNFAANHFKTTDALF